MGDAVGSVLKVAAIVVGVVALAATGAGLIVGATAVTAFLGVSAAALSAAAAVLSVGASLLSPHPKAPATSKATFDRLNVSINTNEPRKAVFGNTAGALDMRDQEIQNVDGTTDGDMYVHRWIVTAAHKVNSQYEIWFEDEKVWTSAGGVINSKYTNFLTVTAINEGTAANYIAYSGRTPAANRLFYGMAYVYLKFFITQDSPFANSIPQKMTVRMKAMPTYDPRKDSTNGGSGTQRPNDCSTWQYDVSGNLQGENPALQLLSWWLGWYITNPGTGQRVLSVGRGIPASRIDMASFITAANCCDETVTLAAGGSERRYRGAGIVSEAEDTKAASDRFKAAMNADLDDVSGKIRITSFVNDLAAPVMSLTEDDVISEFEWHPSNALSADYNIINGRYVNADDNTLYQMTPYPDVVLTSRDGIDRPETVDYDMVQSQSQCERLSKQRLQRAQYPGTFKAVFQFRAHRAQKGDLVNLTFGPLGFLNMPFRIVEKEHNGTGLVPMTLRLENAAIYAWLNNDSAVVAYAQPMVYSRADTPWQRMLNGQWLTGGLDGGVDANLLKDAQFSTTYWSRTSAAFCSRVQGTNTEGGIFPVGSVQHYVAEIDLNHGVQNYSFDKRSLPLVTAGRLYFLTYNAAKQASGMSGTATVRGTITFLNAAGSSVGTLNVDVTLANLPTGGEYAMQVGSMVAPATAVRAKVTVGVLTNTAGGSIRIDNPRLLDKEPGADQTLFITGPASEDVLYDYTGTVQSGEVPDDLLFKLNNAQGPITSGVTWSYTVTSGKVNGLAAVSSAQAMSVTSGVGKATINSVETTGSIRIDATYNGKTVSMTVPVNRIVSDAPAGGGSGGGGGGSSSGSLSSGFNNLNSTSYVAAHSTLITITVPTGHTTATCSANLTYRPTAGVVYSGTVTGKWQRSVSGANTWVDVTATTGTANPTVEDDGTGNLQAFPDTLTLSVTDTGLTAGAAYDYRFMNKLDALHSNSLTGSISVTS